MVSLEVVPWRGGPLEVVPWRVPTEGCPLEGVIWSGSSVGHDRN